MKNSKILWYLLVFAILFTSACKKDEDDPPPPVPVDESSVLATYLESTNSPLGKYYVNTDMPSIITAVDVKILNTTGDIYIIDIRGAADYDTAHIDNAVNVTLGNLLTHVEGVDLSGYQKIAIVCYTGQTAGFGTSLLRLLGYNNVFSMKWGMCSWHEDFAGKWQTNIGNTYASQFTQDATAKGASGGMPTLNTGKTTGQEILETRVDDLLAEGYTPANVTNQAVFANLSNYYIVNYWSEAHYNVGHIPGAMQYTPKEAIAINADLKTLPTDKAVVVYCYTGQTSSFMAAYLRLLGYDAKSLLFGANGMIYDTMVAESMTVFNDDQIQGYNYWTP
ncbi:MAG: rhodanese-like domain-containing protein [Bacteroidales bacterium]|nr:rhodanese-like domain-containing protein [Bacteroidales bacterium]